VYIAKAKRERERERERGEGEGEGRGGRREQGENIAVRGIGRERRNQGRDATRFWQTHLFSLRGYIVT
jgi:hypothetical protein